MGWRFKGWKPCWTRMVVSCQPLIPSHPQGANILINDSGEVRLGEYGLGAWAGGLAGGLRGPGTPGHYVTLSASS